jgi:transposase-like protein
MARRGYPPEFRRRVVELIAETPAAGSPVGALAD